MPGSPLMSQAFAFRTVFWVCSWITSREGTKEGCRLTHHKPSWACLLAAFRRLFLRIDFREFAGGFGSFHASLPGHLCLPFLPSSSVRSRSLSCGSSRPFKGYYWARLPGQSLSITLGKRVRRRKDESLFPARPGLEGLHDFECETNLPMLKSIRLRRAQSRFLNACRNLSEDRKYWSQSDSLRRWILDAIFPVPLLGIHGDGSLLFQALEWLEANCQERDVTVDTLLRYHKLLFSAGKIPAGIFRTHEMATVGSGTRFPSPQRVPLLLKQLIARHLRNGAGLLVDATHERSTIISASLKLYQSVGWIHPFEDGNGRVARLVMNHFLRRHGFGYVVFPPINEEPLLLDALRMADGGDFTKLINFAESHYVSV